MTRTPDAYSIASIDHPIADTLRAEVAAFWIRNGAIASPEEARRRADEMVCIARNAAGEIAGVNTAYVVTAGPEGRNWFAFRMFLRLQDRQLRLAMAMVRAATAALNTRCVEPRAVGVLLVTENQKLMLRSGHRLLSHLGFTRIGRDRRGLEVWTHVFAAVMQ